MSNPHSGAGRGPPDRRSGFPNRADGSLAKLLDSIARIDVLLVDDWAIAPLADAERRDFLEICDDRYATRFTILTSQLPITDWHAQIESQALQQLSDWIHAAVVAWRSFPGGRTS